MADALKFYLMFGAAWVGLGVLVGYIKVRTASALASLLLMITVWPYLLYRMAANVISGEPNGSIWP